MSMSMSIYGRILLVLGTFCMPFSRAVLHWYIEAVCWTLHTEFFKDGWKFCQFNHMFGRMDGQ